MELRPYQKRALKAIKKAYLAGDSKQVIVLATGLGKTIIFAHLINDITKYFKKKALILVHREELLTQARDKLLAVNPDLDIGLEMADLSVASKNDHQVIIASVATIGRANTDRIKKFNPDDFIIIVTDEAHHASASTYKNVYRHFGTLKLRKEEEDTPENYPDGKPLWRSPTEIPSDWNKKLLMLGVTATPSRNDNEGIDKIFDKVTFEYNIIRGIEYGYLSRIKAFRVNTATDLSGIKKVAGDFNQGELADAVNNPERNKLVVKTYLERVPGQQALVFAVDVQHTIDLTQEFKKAGIAAEFITGETPKEKRRQILKDFSTRKVRVLINCAVLTEGFDEPNIQAVMMARPTQSGILFQQMIGRGTRLASGKSCLTIIDFVDNTYRQNLQTTASLLGIPGKLDFQGEDVLEVKEKIDQLLELSPSANLDTLDIQKIDYAIEEVDILSGLRVPEELKEDTQLTWYKLSEGQYLLSMPDRHWTFIRQQITGEYAISDEWYDNVEKMKKVQEIGSYATLQEALHAADQHVLTTYPEYTVVVSSTARWRKLPPKDTQVAQLQRMGVSWSVMEQLNRGTASQLLTKLFNYTRRQRKTKWRGQIS